MTEDDQELRTVFFRVPVEMHDALKTRARQEDRSIAATARVALYEYLDRPPERDVTRPPAATTPVVNARSG